MRIYIYFERECFSEHSSYDVTIIIQAPQLFRNIKISPFYYLFMVSFFTVSLIPSWGLEKLFSNEFLVIYILHFSATREGRNYQRSPYPQEKKKKKVGAGNPVPFSNKL